jgi:spore maturation protein CgeB
MFLSYFYNSHFDPAGFAEIRRLGIPSVNFYCNSIYQFDLVNEVAPAADFAWHAERDAHDLYRAAGATPVWVQMGADPEVYRPVTDLPRVSAACFVGRRYADRDRWLAALARAGVPVEIYGPGWRRQLSADQDAVGEGTRDQYLGRNTPKAGSVAAYIAALRQNMVVDGPIRGVGRSIRQFGYRWQTRRIEPLFEAYARSAVSFSDMAAVFSAHEVVLNFSNVWADGRPGSALIPHVRLRDFEGPMCRTCYITGHSDELQEFYEVGSEIETYSTSEELVDKTRFYLGNPEAASRLREAGYARAVKDHTWDRRFQQLFSRIGVS